ncbi:MAG: exosortase/archaeosortase family protein [Phycisphaeraceae bacterium]
MTTSTSVTTNLAPAQGPPVLISKTGKLWTALIGVLFVAFHWHFFYKMVRIGLDDADWSHVLIIPLISAYYIHLHRQRLMATPRRVCVWGLPFIVAGIVGYVLGIFPIQNGMAMGYSMIMTLFGLVLLLLGPAMMRILWFPIAFMVFAVKVSDAIWSVVASKMQFMAAHGAVALLELTSGLTGMHASLRGSTIDLDYMHNGENVVEAMNVAEACAGMRMLMAFLALGVALAFLFPRTWWQRLIMIALAAPIAIFVNALRVAVLGWLHLIDPSLATGDFHLFVGMLMLIPAAGLLMLVGWMLDKIIIVEGAPPKPPAPLPFDEDPNQVHFNRPAVTKGAGLGAAVVVTLGLSYILLINRLTGHEVINWLGAGLNTAALGLTSVLFLAALGWAWLSIRKGAQGQRLALSQGVVAGVLLAAAAGQTSAINSMGIALTKKPLPLRHSIALAFPEKTGNWELLHQDPALPKDIADELGTDDYFNRYYINTDKVNKADVTPKLNDSGMLAGWPGVTVPGQLAKVHVAYYTGMLDTVPHVPDKCWVVAGQQVVYRQVHTLTLDRSDYEPDPDHPGMVLAHSEGQDETVRLPGKEIETVVFSGADEDGNVTTALYFFLANGDAIASSHQVRFSFNLKDRYSYYCKVEVMFPGISDPNVVAEHAEELLSDLMPDIMAALPDWTEVQAGTYPEPQATDAK